MSSLLLDTHYWLWFASGDSTQLNKHSRSLIEEAANQGELILSAISIWELGMLERKSLVRLGTQIESWVSRALALPGLSLVPLSPEIVLAASRLPGDFHGDPADRMIVATVRVHQSRLLTKDRAILEYGKLFICKNNMTL